MRVVVVGAGIFGTSAARALAARGHEVLVLEAGAPPHPLAESTDLSKIVRLEYGADEEYMALAERALAGWRRWNDELGEALFHETGVAFLARAPLAPGGFEQESLALLLARGHRPERLDAAAIAGRFPAFRPGAYVDGFFDPEGGWVAAGRVVARLAAELPLVASRARELLLQGPRVCGVACADGDHPADAVVVTTGAWIADLVPWLAGSFRPVGQPVFHLASADAPSLPVFGADIANTGWYGFPVDPTGRLKIGHHGPGLAWRPGDPLVVPDGELPRFRDFVERTFPDLVGAPIVGTRICLYCDTHDGDFWIDRHPDRPGLVVAAGGSGHGFKFAPLLGPLIADAVEGRPHPDARRFAWRRPGPPRNEEARHV